ncbi:MAG: hypothetical protein E2O73_10910 [Deltaproteobacteria bacterium]|nr:MAG: hypothetical protein E2O73_10910 [Deltaproteobacteria bacterium]
MCPRNVYFLGSALIVLLAALGPFTVSAQTHMRVTPSIRVSQEYESNVLYRKNNEQSDLITRVVPKLRLDLEGDRGHARVWGRLDSRMYQDVTDLDAVDQFFGWDVDQRLSPRFSVYSEGRLAYVEHLDPVEEGFGDGRPDQRRLQAQAGLRYALTPASSLSASFGYLELDFSFADIEPANGRRDSESRWGALSYVRNLSPRDQILASLSYQETDFSSVGSGLVGLASETDETLAGSIGWSRAWSPAWTTRFTAGLRRLESETEAADDRTLGLVGGVELTRTFERGSLSLSYERESRPSSGLGSTLDTDNFEASYRAQLSERLSLKILGEYDHYRSATESRLETPLGSITIDDEIDTTTLTASVRLDWRIRKRLFTFVSYRYRDQSSDGVRPVGEYYSHRVMLGFQYAYPIGPN